MEGGFATMTRRQAASAVSSLASSTVSGTLAHCTPFTLPSNGIIEFPDMAITLTKNVVFDPQCTAVSDSAPINNLKDSFYASVTPLTYVIAGATVIAWILVFMLTVTPRTGYLGGLSSGQPGFVNAHGIISGASGGGSTLNGTGSRPWLQKVAALAVAVALTIATTDTFAVASRQYDIGFTNAAALHAEVFGSTEIRIMRLISNIFLWLAQVQTLIRLFPRHKEKVLIKWIGFALILFDTIFTCLNLFMVRSTGHGTRFDDAVPTLCYLFELALGLLYAAWVIYYALTKRRYAFYHPKMRNIALIALLSIISVLTPVIFFITDVVNQDIAGWGDYIRWVGQAAASVVVWEWVERIEALEKDEKKDGILGREIFDGDEMLDITPSEEVVWADGPIRRGAQPPSGRDHTVAGGVERGAFETGLSHVTNRLRSRPVQIFQHYPLGRTHSYTDPRSDDRELSVRWDENANPATPARRTNAASPPPRHTANVGSAADSTSAASTIYVVRYQAPENLPQHVKRFKFPMRRTTTSQARQNGRTTEMSKSDADIEETEVNNVSRDHSRWHVVPNPFKRKRTLPPQEVQQARAAAAAAAEPAQSSMLVPPGATFSNWDLRDRFSPQRAARQERRRGRNATYQDVPDLPVTVIPAQPRNHRAQAQTLSSPERATSTLSPQMTRASPTTPPIALNQETTPSARLDISTMDLTAPQSSENEPLTSNVNPDTHTLSPPSALSISPLSSLSSPSLVRDIVPPRADEISQISNPGGGPVIIPAPPRRSPFKPESATTSAIGSVGRTSTFNSSLNGSQRPPSNP